MYRYWGSGQWRDVPRDPIVTPLLAGILFPGGLLGFGGAAGLTIFGVSAGTILTGAVLAGTFAISAINKPKLGAGIGDAVGINAPESRGNVQQSAPIERWIYGRVRAGGAVFIIDDSKPPYLYLGLLLSGRQINAIRGVHISVNDIALSSFAFDQPVFPLAIDGQTYVSGGDNRLTMSFGAGLPTQGIDPILHADFPNLAASYRQRGIARAVFKFKYGVSPEDFQALWGTGVSIPNPLLDIEGAPLYDPRDPSQFYPTDWRDADEVAEAMATWKYRRNGVDVGRTASLVQADYLGHPQAVNYPAGRIRWDEIGRGAEWDEEPVANKDGTSRPRNTIDGVVTMDQSPRTIMEAMLTANQGYLVQDRGRGWTQPLRPRKPVLTIDDDLLLGGFDFDFDRAKTDLVNEVTARFSSSDREYQDIDGPTLVREDLIASDGEKITHPIRLPFHSDYRAVAQTQKQYLETTRLKRSLTCNIKIKALGDDIAAGACVQVWSTVYPKLNGLYDVATIGIPDDFSGLQVSLKECAPNIPIAWDPAVDEPDFTLPPLNVS
ncbi:hypothetical protein CRBSH125_21830 [Afipia carboxidovorans]|nr:hypothetical protein CRBSH125_21830 [Afipia carboxidovorans]